MDEAKHGHMTPSQLQQFPSLSPEQRIQTLLALRAPSDQHFTSMFVEQQCKLREIKSSGPGQSLVIFGFKVDRYYCNGSGNLHGGFQATAFDMCTSIAMQAVAPPGSWVNGGVSRVLSVSYLRPAPQGEDLLLECEVTHVGKTLALLRGTLKRERDGAVVSTCEHNKAAVAAKPGWKI